MKKKKDEKGNKFLYWIPRVVILVFAVLIFVFALLSGIDKNTSLLENSPNALPWLGLLLIVWIAWKHEKIGGYLFLGFGILSVFFFRVWINWGAFLALSLPIIIVGALFLLNYYKFRK